jgi:hypothetical protein
MSPRSCLRARTLPGRLRRCLTVVAGLSVVAFGASCTGDPTLGDVRSLERSTAISFICLAAPGNGSIYRTLAECGDRAFKGVANFGTNDAYPHLYALVVQATRGEIALVDVSSTERNVLDQDPSTPGDNFIPVGDNPVSIVSTEKGTASFVASADLSRPALYGLPSSLLRPCEVDPSRCDAPILTLSSLPACRLPSTPGEMVIAPDPAVNDQTRASCTDPFQDVGGDHPRGNIDAEGKGRQKLIVALPKEGKLVVIDAQSLLDREPGTMDACAIEKEIALDPGVPPTDPVDPIPSGPACAVPETIPPGVIPSATPLPSSLVLQDARLYVGDLALPLIHTFSFTSPCDATELPPFVATSMEDPTRQVKVSEIAVSQRVTPDFKRYLYATDVEDRSVMVFDASDDATTKTPLRTPNEGINPLKSPDRIRFAAAPVGLAIMTRDAPEQLANGIAPFGIRCSPDAALVACQSSPASCDVETAYRTSSDYEDGAGPLTLRGTFGLVALSNGEVAMIDIDDYDSACRAPNNPTALQGCVSTTAQIASDEASCNVVIPNAPRSARYIAQNDEVGRNLPGLQAFPNLEDKDGSQIEVASLVAPTASSGGVARIVVGNELYDIDSNGTITSDNGVENALAMNLEDPRVHVADQEWFVTYEGALPGFFGKKGNPMFAAMSQFVDANAGFCNAGVQSLEAVKASLIEQGEADVEAQARRLADRVVVIEPLAESDDSFWTNAACTFQACQNAFGDVATPTPLRDLIIREAYQGSVDVEAPSDPALFECCFPTLVDYEVRGGNQWMVVGTASGFYHHVIADPTTGVCRNSCDPRLERLNGRAYNQAANVSDSDPAAFIGPMFRFVVISGGAPTVPRDARFRFTTQGGFSPLRIDLQDPNDGRDFIQTQSLRFLPDTDDIVITDGALEGLLFFPGDLRSDPRQFF